MSRSRDAAGGGAMGPPGRSAVERLLSLVAADNAPHAIVVSRNPVDLILLLVPVISFDQATETAPALLRRLLALTPEAA